MAGSSSPRSGPPACNARMVGGMPLAARALQSRTMSRWPPPPSRARRITARPRFSDFKRIDTDLDPSSSLQLLHDSAPCLRIDQAGSPARAAFGCKVVNLHIVLRQHLNEL